MPLLARSIPSPVAVVIRPGAVGSLGGLLADGRISARGDVAIAVGQGIGEQIAQHLKESLPGAPVFKVAGATMTAARELVERLREGFYDAVVGIGGGGTLDVAKYAAGSLGIPFVSVATSLAHDGFASPVAVLDAGGRKGSFGVPIPIGVVVDTDYVRQSPARLTRSGVGDAVSNMSALADWDLAARERGEQVDGLAATLARTAADAILHRDDAIDSPSFLASLAGALLQDGLAMMVAGSSRPCSGACHEISHALDALFPDNGTTHGEQVAVGALFASWLREDPNVEALDACLRRYELPRVPADLGLDADAFAQAVVKGPQTRPDRYTILEHLNLDDAEARRRVDAFIEAFAG